MGKELIEKLSKLKMAESCLRRTLDTICYTSEKRQKLFSEIQKIEKEIKLTKFKLKLEKEMKK